MLYEKKVLAREIPAIVKLCSDRFSEFGSTVTMALTAMAKTYQEECAKVQGILDTLEAGKALVLARDPKADFQRKVMANPANALEFLDIMNAEIETFNAELVAIAEQIRDAVAEPARKAQQTFDQVMRFGEVRRVTGKSDSAAVPGISIGMTRFIIRQHTFMLKYASPTDWSVYGCADGQGYKSAFSYADLSALCDSDELRDYAHLNHPTRVRKLTLSYLKGYLGKTGIDGAFECMANHYTAMNAGNHNDTNWTPNAMTEIEFMANLPAAEPVAE